MIGDSGNRARLHAVCLAVAMLFLIDTQAQDCTLPTYGSWNTGLRTDGYTPDFQVGLLQQNHHITPWFQLPVPGESLPRTYYEKGMAEARLRRLPITLISTQWESLLSKPPYLSIKDDSNPNVLSVTGNVQPQVSPFGSEKYWYEVGLKWTRQPVLARLQELYPDPPAIIFLSNNEHPKLKWHELERDKRYLQQPAAASNLFDSDAKRKLAVQQWQKLYQALQQGMRDGLTNATWKTNARFVGYLATGSAELGKKLLWDRDYLFTDAMMDPYPLFWDGGSFSYYSKYDLRSFTHNPQIEAMNLVFTNQVNREQYPDHYFEVSIWDGHSHDHTDTRRVSEERAKGSSLTDYIAMTKFGAWLLRPALIREFRFYNETLAENRQYTDAIIQIVDEINNDSVLQEFWCHGELVPNRTRQHPYSTRIPDGINGKDRWFMLNNSLDNTSSWTDKKRIQVFSLALRIGARPTRRWLVYAHSTDSNIRSVSVEIPDYQRMLVPVSTSGRYSVVDETRSTVTPVS